MSMFSSRMSMNYIFELIAVLTFAAMGFDIHGFVFWNIVPIIVSALIYNKFIERPLINNSGFHSVVAILLFHCFFHIVMYFDIGKSATGSSTSALAFIFIPIYAVAFGGIVYFISKLIFTVIGKLKTYKPLQ